MKPLNSTQLLAIANLETKLKLETPKTALDFQGRCERINKSPEGREALKVILEEGKSPEVAPAAPAASEKAAPPAPPTKAQ